MAENIVFGVAGIGFIAGALCFILGLAAVKAAITLDVGDPTGRTIKWIWRGSMGGLAAAVAGIAVGVAGLYVFEDDGDRSEVTTASPRGPEATSRADPYELAEVAFVGNPTRAELEPLVRTVLRGTGAEYNDEEVERLGDVLVVLRQESKTGVTEVDILRCMAQSVPIEGVEYHELAALTSSILEVNDGICL